MHLRYLLLTGLMITLDVARGAFRNAKRVQPTSTMLAVGRVRLPESSVEDIYRDREADGDLWDSSDGPRFNHDHNLRQVIGGFCLRHYAFARNRSRGYCTDLRGG
jgi:hypothetical protein